MSDNAILICGPLRGKFWAITVEVWIRTEIQAGEKMRPRRFIQERERPFIPLEKWYKQGA
jgi:hypothetical protein